MAERVAREDPLAGNLATDNNVLGLARMVVLSISEGEDKPLHYATIFHTADTAILTKMDLATAAEISSETAHRNIQSVRPGMLAFEVSAKTGVGMEEVLGWMKRLARLVRSELLRPGLIRQN